jgi:transcription-repair coupling factor (superfamily II helicase)
LPAAALAVALKEAAGTSKGCFVFLAAGDRRAEEIARALTALAPALAVSVLPPWDCLPYDRASPSRDVMGRRLLTQRRLARREVAVLVSSPAALVQRMAPSNVVEEAVFRIEAGASLDRAALAQFAARTGYVIDDRIDEPGEIAFFGEVIDVFPADQSNPVRITVSHDGVAQELKTYDPISQRSLEMIEALTLGPASELVLTGEGSDAERHSGAEHGLAAIYGTLATVYDLLPEARVAEDALFRRGLFDALEQIADAHAAHLQFSGSGSSEHGMGGLYLTGEEVAAGLQSWTSTSLKLGEFSPGVVVAGARNPGRAFCDLVEDLGNRKQRVILAGQRQERGPLYRALKRGLQISPRTAKSWEEALAAAPGDVVGLELDIEGGFMDAERSVAVIAASDVLGGRIAARSTGLDVFALEPELRPGDVVLHEDHGIGVLRELETVEIDGHTRDTLRLEYNGGAALLASVAEIGRIWRYGAEEAAVTLDRLKGDAWPKRRAEISRHLDEAAERLVALARAREALRCAPIVTNGRYAKFAARFGYPESPGQAAAIAAVLDDLGAGRPMDRLVCGDVGFGKTEVALRAAAAVAFSGRQVAICAPTTVLAKQHLQTFQRRFAGTGLKIAHLSRLVAARDAAAARDELAAGDADIVIGTHALASEKVSFANLGLIIIDEEQKFGAAVKQRLRGLAEGAHCLSMTATPIPRTLQAAMVGIQSVSVIASPPARRRPIRTFIAPFDSGSVRTALLRERRRGGQSFVVCPRIDDIAGLQDQLATLAPDLSVRVAHGGLPADKVDEEMVGFAEGEGDVLLATNIIESGLDVPRANTMIVWRPDRFGLAQLHQLRGRVGRGRVQGVAYLLHDPEEVLSDTTLARLSTLEAFDRLGSGLAISARDLDLRGGGDLTGDEQAGHIRLVGAALYHRLLARAVQVARGETPPEEQDPVVEIGIAGSIPEHHVPDAVTRINLYAQLSRASSVEDVDRFEEEVEDRFGPMPAELAGIIQTARLKSLARERGVREVHAGPKAVALVLPAPQLDEALAALKRVTSDAKLKEDRVIVSIETVETDRVAAVERVLCLLAPLP